MRQPHALRSFLRDSRVGEQASADVGAALGDGFDEALVAEEGDGAAGGSTGHFKCFDDLGLGGDAGALGVFARFDA